MTRTGPTLLDEVLPVYDVSAEYSIQIHASPDRIYQVLQNGVPSGTITKMLMLLRGIPRFFSTKRTRQPEGGFFKLKQLQNREIVIGIAGQFWKAVATPIPIHNLDEFIDFQKAGFCKAALNLRIHQKGKECVLTTETRVLCFGSAKEDFLSYWNFIAPFSGLIRKEILRKIKKKAEEFHHEGHEGH